MDQNVEHFHTGLCKHYIDSNNDVKPLTVDACVSVAHPKCEYFSYSTISNECVCCRISPSEFVLNEKKWSTYKIIRDNKWQVMLVVIERSILDLSIEYIVSINQSLCIQVQHDQDDHHLKYKCGEEEGILGSTLKIETRSHVLSF